MTALLTLLYKMRTVLRVIITRCTDSLTDIVLPNIASDFVDGSEIYMILLI